MDCLAESAENTEIVRISEFGIHEYVGAKNFSPLFFLPIFFALIFFPHRMYCIYVTPTGFKMYCAIHFAGHTPHLQG